MIVNIRIVITNNSNTFVQILGFGSSPSTKKPTIVKQTEIIKMFNSIFLICMIFFLLSYVNLIKILFSVNRNVSLGGNVSTFWYQPTNKLPLDYCTAPSKTTSKGSENNRISFFYFPEFPCLC